MSVRQLLHPLWNLCHSLNEDGRLSVMFDVVSNVVVRSLCTVSTMCIFAISVPIIIVTLSSTLLFPSHEKN